MSKKQRESKARVQYNQRLSLAEIALARSTPQERDVIAEASGNLILRESFKALELMNNRSKEQWKYTVQVVNCVDKLQKWIVPTVTSLVESQNGLLKMVADLREMLMKVAKLNNADKNAITEMIALQQVQTENLQETVKMHPVWKGTQPSIVTESEPDAPRPWETERN